MTTKTKERIVKVFNRIWEGLPLYLFLAFIFCIIVGGIMTSSPVGEGDYDSRMEWLRTAGNWFLTGVIFVVVAFIIFVVQIVATESSCQKTKLERLEIGMMVKAKTKDGDKFFEQYQVTSERAIEIEAAINNDNPEVEEFKNNLTHIIGTTPTNNMIIWGLLAKDGKILPRYLFANKKKSPLVRANAADKWSSLGLTDEQITACWVKYLKWYDNEMRNHGISYQLMFVELNEQDTFYDREFFKKWKPIQECNENCSADIVVFWKPAMTECIYKRLRVQPC